MSEKTIGGILHRIQKELKAPKGQTNTFGKYKYRSAEDILEAVKGCLQEGEFINVSDQMVMVGDRIYVEATASLVFGSDHIHAKGYAREQETKAGMDQAQITGAASSYARKYSLNGLFCIDDTKDADSMDNSKDKPEEKTQVEDVDKFTPDQRASQSEIITRISQAKDEVEIDAVLDEYGQQMGDLPAVLAETVNEQLQNSRAFLKTGGKPNVTNHRFPSVGAATKWMIRMKPVIDGFKNEKQLREWQTLWQPFLNGLSCLDAEKNKVEGKTPKERIIDALADKLTKLTPVG